MGTTAFVITLTAVLLTPSLALGGWLLYSARVGPAQPLRGRSVVLYGPSGGAQRYPAQLVAPLPEFIVYGGITYTMLAAPVDWGQPVEYLAMARTPHGTTQVG